MKKQVDNRRERTKPSRLRGFRLFIFFFILPFSLAIAYGQPEFNVTAGTEATPEGDDVNIMVIQTGQRHFELRVPKNFGAQVNPDDQSIVFTSATGSSVITVKMSTNYAGELPQMEQL